ncbi:hypothetical protein [Streptomyces sp. NPDC012888]|uniref:hypothetical protein n=1 Tax=Streptomyces sp. NPDC012888 TaxID=3364855 RepID=UPI0036C430E3
MAALALRAGADWADEARFVVAEAARHGHGDAVRLLAGLAHRRPAREPGPYEDAEYFEEVRTGLGVPEHVLHPDTGPSSAGQDGGGWGGERGRRPGGPPTVREEPPAGQPRLFLVPAPQVPSYGPDPQGTGVPAADARRPHLTALPTEGPRLALPDLRPDAAVAAVRHSAIPAGGVSVRYGPVLVGMHGDPRGQLADPPGPTTAGLLHVADGRQVIE